MACIYAFIITMFVYRDYKWRELPLLMARVVRTVGMVMMLIGFAAAFGYMMALMQLPAKITQFFLSVSDNKYIILLLINIILLMLGCLMDMAPLIVICTPILLPVAVSIGIDPVHFGMILLVNLGMGLITPPVGATLFVGCAVGRVTDRRDGAHHLAVLPRHARCSGLGHLRSRNFHVAAIHAQAVSWVAERAPARAGLLTNGRRALPAGRSTFQENNIASVPGRSPTRPEMLRHQEV